ncbi:hypothetical protein [Brenneria goodwinii]|uniref:hypothetical protein n=1 Tax=Brenneria goodwinii TaxID=1109412 RepID=UPI001600D888|nr:hypothetical protein [Brenneria goodwinii]
MVKFMADNNFLTSSENLAASLINGAIDRKTTRSSFLATASLIFPFNVFDCAPIGCSLSHIALAGIIAKSQTLCFELIS